MKLRLTRQLTPPALKPLTGPALRCNYDYMNTEIQGWFAGRLPDEWFTEPAEVTVDREEITIVGTLSEPDSDDAEAAAEGRIRRFREDTRARRIDIASE